MTNWNKNAMDYGTTTVPKFEIIDLFQWVLSQKYG